MVEFEFKITKYKYVGETEEKYLLKREVSLATKSKAETYLKRKKGSYAYIGSQSKNIGLGIYYTRDKKFAVEIWNKNFKRVKLFKTFDDVLEFAARRFDKGKIKVKISELVSNPTPWAKKYKYDI